MTSADPLVSNDRLTAELKRLSWAKGLAEETIQELVQMGEYSRVEPETVVHCANQKLTSVMFVISGRLQVSVLDIFGKIIIDRPLSRGGVLRIILTSFS